jgi:hypothetical protein
MCAAVALVFTARAGKGADAKGRKDDVVVCGAAIGAVPEVPLAHAIAYPGKYVGKTVIVTGLAEEVCQQKGCWMQVVPEAGQKGIRMTFKDYGFFVPKDAGGMTVRAEGTFVVSVLDKATADHLVAEGASLTLNPDGTADEIGFVANGVELRKTAEKKAD